MSQVSSRPVTIGLGADQPPAGLTHGGKRLGQEGVELARQRLLVVGLQLVEAALEAVPLVRILAVVLGLPHFLEFGLRGAEPLGQARAEARRLSADLLVGERGEPCLFCLDGFDDRPDLLHFPVVLRAEDHLYQFLDHACPFLYSPWAAM